MSDPSYLYIEFKEHPEKQELTMLQETLTKIFGKYAFWPDRGENKGSIFMPYGYAKNPDNTVSILSELNLSLSEISEPELFNSTKYYCLNISNNEHINELFTDDIEIDNLIPFFTMASFILMQPNVEHIFIVDEYRTRDVPLLDFIGLIKLFETILLNKKKEKVN